jgi:hypothetical protein
MTSSGKSNQVIHTAVSDDNVPNVFAVGGIGDILIRKYNDKFHSEQSRKRTNLPPAINYTSRTWIDRLGLYR